MVIFFDFTTFVKIFGGGRMEEKTILDECIEGYHVCYLSEPIHLEYASSNLCKLTGYSNEDFKNKFESEYSRIILQQDVDRFEEFVLKLAAKEQTEAIQYRIVRKDGKVILVNDVMTSKIAEDGSMWGYSTVCKLKDVEEQRLSNIKYAHLTNYETAETKNHRNVYISTFSYNMSVYVDDRQVEFSSEKAFELFAILVDKRGEFVTADELVELLWEGNGTASQLYNRLRKVVWSLNKTLTEYGIEDLLISGTKRRRLDISKVKCDYYDFIKNPFENKNLFSGVYMTRYSWSCFTLEYLKKLHDEVSI